MPDATKRILTDETGQDIVSALETLCTLVDPNGTAVAAAEKINNMTISVSGIAAGSSPTASVSEVDGHKHIALSIPVELPVVSSQDNGKVMVVKNGAWGSDMMDNATSETAGLMSAEDKQKLDGIEEIDIYQEIESDSNSVNFSDGAEAPLKELVIDIEPKQDLHGYDKPWVGGAGKNKADPTKITNQQLNTNGSLASNDYYRTLYVASLPAGTYTYSTDCLNCYMLRMKYTANGTTPITDFKQTAQAVTFTLDSTVTDFYICFRNTTTTTLPDSIKYQLESGSTATTWEPYENLCPIQGWDEVPLVRISKNLIYMATLHHSYANASTGKLNATSQASGSVSYYLETKYLPNQITFNATNGNRAYVCYMNDTPANEVQCYGIDQTSQTLPKTVTVDKTYKYIHIQFSYNQAITNPQIEPGSTATAYEEPIAHTYDISIPSEAGTVYGGTITLNESGEGELNVDTAIGTITGCSSVGTSSITGSTGKYANLTGISAIGVTPLIDNTKATINFDRMGSVSFNNRGAAWYGFVSNTTTIGCFVPSDMTAEQVSEMLTGIQFAVKIATPITYTLTANQVQTLLGYNYIYTDGAKISLTYAKDTAGLMTTADKIKLNSYPTKLSQLTNDAGYLTSHQSLDSVAPKADPVFTGSISLGRKANTTTGTNSFAVGNTVEASGANSHAEGNETRASYQDAHAEGWGSEASSQAAHAEGRQGRATAYATHAEGVQTTASGYAAHAQGVGTQAKNRAQHTAGEYNVLDPSTNGAGVHGTYAEIIGNGADANNRSNARALDWDGNERLMGDVYVGCDADSTGGTKLIKATDTMTGATSSAAGAAGLVPAPATTDVDKFLSGDGTYKSGGLPMVILSYGNSTWSDFINAYRNNVIVYCRASSNANPASGKQTRMAFMAYVNDADNPTQVEFQYYRSMTPTNKSISQMSDQVFVYTLSSNGTWSVISREASIKSIVFDASSGLTGTYDKNTGTLTISAAT